MRILHAGGWGLATWALNRPALRVEPRKKNAGWCFIATVGINRRRRCHPPKACGVVVLRGWEEARGGGRGHVVRLCPLAACAVPAARDGGPWFGDLPEWSGTHMRVACVCEQC